jgi:hypothetical protein
MHGSMVLGSEEHSYLRRCRSLSKLVLLLELFERAGEGCDAADIVVQEAQLSTRSSTGGGSMLKEFSSGAFHKLRQAGNFEDFYLLDLFYTVSKRMSRLIVD